MRYWILALLGLLAVAACEAPPVVASSDEMVAKSIYRHSGPPRITLFTMINNGSGAGRHSSLMINGSQRVIFDPAGTFRHEHVAEQQDVIYGITPHIVDGYTRYHARETYHVLVQQVDVSAEVADMAIRATKAHGAVPGGRCAQSTSGVLAGLPGFEHIAPTWYPNALARQFAAIPGVTSRTLHEYDSDDNSKVLATWEPRG